VEANLASKLLDFLREEKIKMKVRMISDSEFWLEGPYGFF